MFFGNIFGANLKGKRATFIRHLFLPNGTSFLHELCIPSVLKITSFFVLTMRYLTCQHLLAWSPCQAQISWRLRHLSSHPENQKIELIRECKIRCRLVRLIVSLTTWTPIIELGHKKRKTGLKPL